MPDQPYLPPTPLRNGWVMTVHAALRAGRNWEQTLQEPEPFLQPHIFRGHDGVPIAGRWGVPAGARGTLIATYGITGDLDNQWLLRIQARKAFARGYALVLFDWRAHGETLRLSPVLTSDGLHEGRDYLQLAAQAKALGCPAPYWFCGYSLGGQLALWGVYEAQRQDLAALGLRPEEIGGGAVLCPNLDSNRSLTYLTNHPWGRQLEKAIVRQLKLLIRSYHQQHPGQVDPRAVHRLQSIADFDHEFVIGRLGFASVADYYAASSVLPWLERLQRPTLIIYAEDDPLFSPEIPAELAAIAREHPHLHLHLTRHGGHLGYISSGRGQRACGDPDRWWAVNRMLDWLDARTPSAARALASATMSG